MRTLSTTTLSLQYRREYPLSSLRDRVTYSGADHIHHPINPLFPPFPPLPAFLLLLHIDNLSICFVCLPSYMAYLYEKKSLLKFEVVAERMLVFDEWQTRGFIMYHQLNSISFISTLFHRLTLWRGLLSWGVLGSVQLLSVVFADWMKKDCYFCLTTLQFIHYL